MNISEPFVRRPVMTGLVMISILVFGIIAYRQLPVSDLPNVDFPTISVTANLPGASAETMASAVATPLEKQFSTIASLDSMSSVSAQGTSQITLQFSLSRNIDAAAQDVQSAIATALKQLPPEMPTPPDGLTNHSPSSVLLVVGIAPLSPASCRCCEAAGSVGQSLA